MSDKADGLDQPSQKTRSRRQPDTATARLEVRATTKAVDPMVVVFSLAAQAGGNLVNADYDSAFQPPR